MFLCVVHLPDKTQCAQQVGSNKEYYDTKFSSYEIDCLAMGNSRSRGATYDDESVGVVIRYKPPLVTLYDFA